MLPLQDPEITNHRIYIVISNNDVYIQNPLNSDDRTLLCIYGNRTIRKEIEAVEQDLNYSMFNILTQTYNMVSA